jgi:hypothetical protein
VLVFMLSRPCQTRATEIVTWRWKFFTIHPLKEKCLHQVWWHRALISTNSGGIGRRVKFKE